MNIKKISEQNATHPMDSERFYTKEVFECGKYTMEVVTSNYFEKKYIAKHYNVNCNGEKYLPRIYYNDLFDIDDESTPYFTIQTTSYGDLKPDEIKEMVTGYNEALEAVEALTKEFIK